MNVITCHGCQRGLDNGEMAWAADWAVVDLAGNSRMETRFTCDDCEADQ